MVKKISSIILSILIITMLIPSVCFAKEVKDPLSGAEIEISEDAIIIVTANDCKNMEMLEAYNMSINGIQSSMSKKNIMYDAIYPDYEVVAYSFKNSSKLDNSSIDKIDIEDYKKEFIKQVGEKYVIEVCEISKTGYGNDLNFVYTKFYNSETNVYYTNAFTYTGDYTFSLYYLPVSSAFGGSSNAFSSFSNILGGDSNSPSGLAFASLLTVYNAMDVFSNMKIKNASPAGTIIKILITLIILGALGFVVWKFRDKIKPYLSKDGIKNIKELIPAETFDKAKSVVSKENLEKTKDSLNAKFGKTKGSLNTKFGKQTKEDTTIDDTQVIFGAIGSNVASDHNSTSNAVSDNIDSDSTEILNPENIELAYEERTIVQSVNSVEEKTVLQGTNYSEDNTISQAITVSEQSAAQTSEQNKSMQVLAEDNMEAIKKYKELLDEGVITAEEFAEKRKQLLNL